VLSVEIHSVVPNPSSGTGWTGLFEGFGALSTDVYGIQPPVPAGVAEVRYTDSTAFLPIGDGFREVEMRPFLGTIGVAPALERRLTFSQAPEYLGDVDQPGITAGATVMMPVNVEGGLLALGDAHGAQGDGEITGVAIEIEATVELTVTAMSIEEAGYVALPQLNTADTIGSIAGFQGVNLGDCARAAYTDLLRRLVRHHGLSETDAHRLLGQVGRLQVGNMIDPFYSVCASVERRFIEG
jgi:acetamidase/formamidase